MPEKIWYLKQCDLFGRLEPEELARLESQCRVREFPPKSLIYLPTDEADGVVLLAEGQAKICTLTEEGKQAILAFIEPGELFGELALIEPGSREEYAEAVERCRVILIPAGEMQRLMERHPTVSLAVTRLIGLRRKRFERRLKSLLFKSNRERLVHLLVELAEQYGYRTGEGVRLRVKLSHQDLANIIGSTRESVTLALGQLQLEGQIKVGRRKLILRDPARLAQSVAVPVPEVGRDARLPAAAPNEAAG